jgi:hypothetical protein
MSIPSSTTFGDRRLIVTVIAAVAGASVIAAIAIAMLDDARRADLVFELGKALSGFLTVGLAGVVLNAVIKARDARQQSDKEQGLRAEAALKVQDAWLRGFYTDLLVAYHGIKATRRHLRGVGLADPWDGEISADQLAVLDAEMGALIDAQLAVERLWRQAASPSAELADQAGVRAGLAEIESFANGVIKEWEARRRRLHPGSRLAELSDWTLYASFTHEARGTEALIGQPAAGPFGDAVSAMHRVEALINRDLQRMAGRGEMHVPGQPILGR